MNAERKHRIVEAVQQYMTSRRLSQRRLANELGMSETGISFLLRQDHWEKIADDQWRRLEVKFGSQQNWPVYEHSNYRAIQRMCADAQRQGATICIAEYTGAGKTLALRQYTRKHPNVFMVECDQLMTQKDLAVSLQRALGISNDRTRRDMVLEIIDELSRYDRPLVIFDEVDKLSDRCLMMLKLIYDKLEGECGFITAGTEVLRERIERAAQRNKLGYREFKRRFGNWAELRRWDTADRVIRREIIEICQDQGISDETHIRYILKHATNWGDVRALVTRLRAAEAATETEPTEEVAPQAIN